MSWGVRIGESAKKACVGWCGDVAFRKSGGREVAEEPCEIGDGIARKSVPMDGVDASLQYRPKLVQ